MRSRPGRHYRQAPRQPVQTGPGGDWRKIKCVRSDTFAVVGYEPSMAMAGAIGSLLLAARKDDDLQYVGGVGTGFKPAEARDLRQRLDAIRVKRPAVKVKGKSLVFVDPIIAAKSNIAPGQRTAS